MKCLLVSTFTSFLISLSGCSVYRSEGRKQFESAAPEKLSTTSLYQFKECKTSGSLENWFNEEFPSQTYELIVANNDLEIWHSAKNSSIEIEVIQKLDSKIHSCIYEFATESDWNAYKDQFIRELENNVRTLE